MSRTVSAGRRRRRRPRALPGSATPEINFYLLETADGLVLVDGGRAGISRSYSHTWKAPVAR